MFKLATDSKTSSADKSVVSYIEQTLSSRKLVFQFPNQQLEHQFIRKRISDSLTFIHTGHYLLLVLFIFIIFNVWTSFSDIIVANNYALVINSYIPLTVAILFILQGSRLAAIQRHFYWYMTPVSIAILCIVSRIIVQYQGGYGELAIYHLMTTIILMAFGLRFILPVFISILVAVGLFNVVYSHVNHLNLNYAKFNNYYTLYCCVTIALCAISEWRERLAFLQGLLIDHQTTELTRLNNKLDRIAHEDALTGIANRRCFDETARKEWDRAIREQQPLTIILLDVDFFKLYNDHYGHDMGDTCLHSVAQILQQSVMRTADIAARYGGEEFVILLANTDTHGGIMVAERIRNTMIQQALPHAVSSVAPYVTVSMGLTSFIPSNHITLPQMLKQADQALYRAKHQGRHQFVAYQSMNPSTDSTT